MRHLVIPGLLALLLSGCSSDPARSDDALPPLDGSADLLQFVDVGPLDVDPIADGPADGNIAPDRAPDDLLTGEEPATDTSPLDARPDATAIDGCQPTTCAAQRKNCGLSPDGCGNALDCGSCTAPEECGGSGTVNVCGSGACFIEQIYPLSGTQLPWSPTWTFAVKEVWGASSYLWGFFQSGILKLEKVTSDPVLGIPNSSPDHAALSIGAVELWVRASYDPGRPWTCARITTFTLY